MKPEQFTILKSLDIGSMNSFRQKKIKLSQKSMSLIQKTSTPILSLWFRLYTTHLLTDLQIDG